MEALIVERGDAFAVDADLLVRLDDAGVPRWRHRSVVAVSFPERFAVKAGPVPVEEYADGRGVPTPTQHLHGRWFLRSLLLGDGFSLATGMATDTPPTTTAATVTDMVVPTAATAIIDPPPSWSRHVHRVAG